jgi:glutathionylspermidine synthase
MFDITLSILWQAHHHHSDLHDLNFTTLEKEVTKESIVL